MHIMLKLLTVSQYRRPSIQALDTSLCVTRQLHAQELLISTILGLRLHLPDILERKARSMPTSKMLPARHLLRKLARLRLMAVPLLLPPFHRISEPVQSRDLRRGWRNSARRGGGSGWGRCGAVAEDVGAHEIVGEGFPFELGDYGEVGGRRKGGEALFELGGGGFEDALPLVDEDG